MIQKQKLNSNSIWISWDESSRIELFVHSILFRSLFTWKNIKKISCFWKFSWKSWFTLFIQVATCRFIQLFLQNKIKYCILGQTFCLWGSSRKSEISYLNYALNQDLCEYPTLHISTDNSYLRVVCSWQSSSDSRLSSLSLSRIVSKYEVYCLQLIMLSLTRKQF